MVDTVAPMVSPETLNTIEGLKALQRLVEIAKGDSGQCRRVANFLLAWWNAGELGGFDFTDLWNVDGVIADDMVSVFAMVARHHVYPNQFGLQADFEDLVRCWRPSLIDA